MGGSWERRGGARAQRGQGGEVRGPGVELGSGTWQGVGLGMQELRVLAGYPTTPQVSAGSPGRSRCSARVPPHPRTSAAGPAVGCSNRRRRRGPRCTPRSAAGTPSRPASGSCCRCLGAEGSTWTNAGHSGLQRQHHPGLGPSGLVPGRPEGPVCQALCTALILLHGASWAGPGSEARGAPGQFYRTPLCSS